MTSRGGSGTLSSMPSWFCWFAECKTNGAMETFVKVPEKNLGGTGLNFLQRILALHKALGVKLKPKGVRNAKHAGTQARKATLNKWVSLHEATCAAGDRRGHPDTLELICYSMPQMPGTGL